MGMDKLTTSRKVNLRVGASQQTIGTTDFLVNLSIGLYFMGLDFLGIGPRCWMRAVYASNFFFCKLTRLAKRTVGLLTLAARHHSPMPQVNRITK